jgi:hypothetical protein
MFELALGETRECGCTQTGAEQKEREKGSK